MQSPLDQIQTDIAGRLGAELYDWGVAVRSRFELVIEPDVEAMEIVTTMVNGRSGAGCIVEAPSFTASRPNIPGPQGEINVVVTVQEAPEINRNAATGTMRSAATIAKRVAELLHLFGVYTVGTLQGGSVREAASDSNTTSYKVSFSMAHSFDVLAKTAMPTITSALGEVMITASEGAAYFTVDGSTFPTPTNGVGGSEFSFLYSSAFPAASGTVIRAVSYATGKTGSNVAEHTV